MCIYLGQAAGFKLGAVILLIMVCFTLTDITSVGAKPAVSASDRAIDIQAVTASRNGLQRILDFVGSQPDLFLPAQISEDELLTREKRMAIWETWQSFLDHILLLDVIGHKYSGDYLSSRSKNMAADSFFVGFAAFLTGYRYSLDFIELMERNPELAVILNDLVPEFGLSQSSYARFKFRFLNVLRGAEFARLYVLFNYYKNSGNNPFKEYIQQDIKLIWQAGKGKGIQMTTENALKVVSDMGFTVWFPVQKSVASMMGHVKVWRPGSSLISSQQIKMLAKKLEPGDILLERREWYASNLGIPGFWTHAALYVGTPEERAAYFADDLESRAWLSSQDGVNDELEEFLQARYPKQYLLSLQLGEDGNPPRIVEAIEPGVSFTSLEHSVAADSVAVLRPKLSKKEKALAIIRAFHYSGRPYDYNFDFRTDSALVCSELVYKAYEPSEAGNGLSLPLHEMMGRPILSPNIIAQLFAQEYKSGKSQFELVSFLDGNEYQGRTVESDPAEFLKSCQRPKYHILLP